MPDCCCSRRARPASAAPARRPAPVACHHADHHAQHTSPTAACPMLHAAPTAAAHSGPTAARTVAALTYTGKQRWAAPEA
jgi:hypothetical protein